jgi:hypothetical protein
MDPSALQPMLLAADDPLAIDPGWAPTHAPGLSLTAFETALETTLLRSGLSREEWIKRLAVAAQKRVLLPLLWLLPRGWRLAPAQLPPQLHTLAGVLERGLLNPLLLAALADDLPHLFPPAAPGTPSALELWGAKPDCASIAALLQIDPTGQDSGGGAITGPPPSDLGRGLGGGLVWENRGLSFAQTAAERLRNSQAAQLLNRLGANLHGHDPWLADGCTRTASWVQALVGQGWSARARLRCSVASFGLGAAMPTGAGGWSQVPLALPIRTGLLAADGTELQALLPHSALELELGQGPIELRLQYYQGTEGLCGWAGLNDLHRPWQNDRSNGTVRYLGQPIEGERLVEALDLCDVIALVHNLEASDRQLLRGGYGTLGFCIDTSALIQQALEGRCQLFPVLLGGIWRARLHRRAERLAVEGSLPEAHRLALERYRIALAALPLDLSITEADGEAARQRLRASQPATSPFLLVQRLQQQLQAGAVDSRSATT